MRAIFISYRREDTEGQAGRLFDDLVRHFGEDAVFMDVAGIEPGRDFRQAIDEQVASCGVLLAVIGKSWCDATDAAGRRRLDDPLDFVRLETASALKRDIPVIPVLVRGASMPRAEQLPPDLAELAYRNAVELTHARWDSDVQVLVRALRPYVDLRRKEGGSTTTEQTTRGLGEAWTVGTVGPVVEPGVDGPASVAPVPSAKKSGRLRVGVSVAAIIVAIGGYVVWQSVPPPSPLAINRTESTHLAVDNRAIRRADYKTFVQFAGAVDRNDVREMMRSLQAAGWNVQGVEGGGQRTPAAAGQREIRYAQPGDEAAAKALAQEVQAKFPGSGTISTKLTPGVSPGNIEVWVSR